MNWCQSTTILYPIQYVKILIAKWKCHHFKCELAGKSHGIGSCTRKPHARIKIYHKINVARAVDLRNGNYRLQYELSEQIRLRILFYCIRCCPAFQCVSENWPNYRISSNQWWSRNSFINAGNHPQSHIDFGLVSPTFMMIVEQNIGSTLRQTLNVYIYSDRARFVG